MSQIYPDYDRELRVRLEPVINFVPLFAVG